MVLSNGRSFTGAYRYIESKVCLHPNDDHRGNRFAKAGKQQLLRGYSVVYAEASNELTGKHTIYPSSLKCEATNYNLSAAIKKSNGERYSIRYGSKAGQSDYPRMNSF